MMGALKHWIIGRACHCEMNDLRDRRAKAVIENDASARRVYTAALDSVEQSNASYEAVKRLLDRMEHKGEG